MKNLIGKTVTINLNPTLNVRYLALSVFNGEKCEVLEIYSNGQLSVKRIGKTGSLAKIALFPSEVVLFEVRFTEWQNNHSEELEPEYFASFTEAKARAIEYDCFTVTEMENPNNYLNNGTQCRVYDNKGNFIFQPE